jgi:predicted nucleotidyltransferase
LIVDELKSIYHCHTVILYGSRARGDYTATSDYDVAGISSSGEKKRIARFDEKHNVYHDIFIYPENDFSSLKEEHLTMADGVVIIDHNDFGKNLILKLRQMFEESESISKDEIQIRKVWYRKMLSRASVDDLEGRYRHIWAIFTIIEDYFAFKGLRYQGPKKAFQYLEANDPEALLLFKDALYDTNDLKALNKLITRIVGVSLKKN